MRNSYRSVVVACTLAVFLQLPGTANAGPVEQLTQITLHPSDPDIMVVRYINGGDGMLFSRDGGMSWKLLCLSAINPMLNRGGTISLAGDGKLLLGVFDGLYQDQGNGCDFEMEPSMQGRWVTDVAQHPTDPNISFAITSTGNEAQNGIVQRSADGTFTDLGDKQVMQISRLRVVSTDSGLRFYESAVGAQVMTTLDGGVMTLLPSYIIRVSDDNAQTFRVNEYGTTDGSFRLQGVDPTDPDRIVAIIDREGVDDEVLVSSDQGAHFESYLTLTQFGALAFAPDGRVFIGEARRLADPDASSGLWSASSLAVAPQKIGDYPVQCLAWEKSTDTLFVCQPYSFGTADPGTGAFTKRFDFTTVESFITCEGVDMPAACETQLCRDYCGPGHFAQAPVCSAYTSPVCGPCLVAMEMGATSCESAGIAGVGAGGAAGRAMAGSTAAAGSGGMGGGGGSTALDAGTAGATGGKGGGGDDGGCATRGAGLGSAAGSAAWLLGLLFVTIARRRRRHGS